MKTAKQKNTKIVVQAPAPKAPVAVRAPKPAVETKAAPAPAPAVKKTVPAVAISTEQIATRAYLIWEQHDRPQGNEQANWLEAEKQLQQELKPSAA
jgi:hypothetical protein